MCNMVAQDTYFFMLFYYFLQKIPTQDFIQTLKE